MRGLVRWPALFLGALAGLVTVSLAAPTVETSATAGTIAVGDTFRLNLRIVCEEGTTVKPMAVPDKIGNFVVKDVSVGSPSAGTGGPGDSSERLREASLLLTTFETGTQTVPPVSLVYVGPDGSTGSVESRPVEIEVRSILPEDADDLRDIKRPLEVPKRWKDLILSYLLVFGLAAGAALSVLLSFKRREEVEARLRRAWLRVSAVLRALANRLLAALGIKRKGRAFDIAVDEPGLPAGEAALRELERIEALGLAGRKMIVEFYTLVSETVRRYIERRYGVLALESPTSYTLAALERARLSGAALPLIGEALSEADLVKFAKWIPDEERVGSLLARARDLIERTAEPVAPAPESTGRVER